MVSDTGFVKPHWALDHEIKSVTWPQMEAQQMQELASDPDVTITGFDELVSPAGALVYSKVKTKIKAIRKNGLAVDPMPHWEFICSRECQDINDEYGKGHRTTVSLDYLKRINRARGGDYFKGLEELERVTEEGSPPAESGTDGESERRSYLDHQEQAAEPGRKGPRDPRSSPSGSPGWTWTRTDTWRTWSAGWPTASSFAGRTTPRG